MGLGERRKCKCCLKFFRPDRRNRGRQFYCSAAACRAARKAASQARWRAKPENQNHFRGEVNVAASGRGGRATPAIGGRGNEGSLRYKMSQSRNPLIQGPKRPLSRDRRYKMS